jgi:hypothetical protein
MPAPPAVLTTTTCRKLYSSSRTTRWPGPRRDPRSTLPAPAKAPLLHPHGGRRLWDVISRPPQSRTYQIELGETNPARRGHRFTPPSMSHPASMQEYRSVSMTKDGTTQPGGERFRCRQCRRRFTRHSSSTCSGRAFADDIIVLGNSIGSRETRTEDARSGCTPTRVKILTNQRARQRMVEP